MITNYYMSAYSASSAIDKDEDEDVNQVVQDIHAKNVWCCGEGYFGQKKIAEKVRKSRQNVNRDKSA